MANGNGITQLEPDRKQYSPPIAKDGALERAKNFFIEQMKRRGESELLTTEAQRASTPSAGQVTNFLSMLAPGAGIADAAGEYPALPSREQPFTEAFSGEPYPSMDENLARGGWGGSFDASMQGLGAFGDALWATPLIGPFLGATVGTGAKGIAALGKVAKAATKTGKASKGIIALDEAKQLLRADVDQFAKDDLGFISPTIQALIEKAPAKLKGQQIVEWAKGNANKGVKPKELEFLGLDEFVAANPNATTREAVAGISGNKVRVSKSIISGEGEALEFERTVPDTDPLDDSNLWEPQAEDLRYGLEQGDEDVIKELLDHYNKEWRVNKSEIPKPMIDEVVEDFAKKQYRQNPYEMIQPLKGERFSDLQMHPGTFAFGNEDVGYQLFNRGERVADTGRYFGSANSRAEAEIQLKEMLGLEDFTGGTEFKQWVDNSLPGGENYREVVFNWDNAPETHTYGHLAGENQIAHALIRDRKLSDGTDSLHIDELQSDLHTAGSQEGYSLSPAQRKEVFRKLEDFLKDNTTYTKEQAQEVHAFFHRQLAERDSTIAASIINELGDKPDPIADIIRPILYEGTVPNYPYKDDWYKMGINQLLLDAIADGKDALSISGSAPIKERYSEEYYKFYEMLYDKKIPSAMKKLANKYGGEFEKGQLDLTDTFGMNERNIEMALETDAINLDIIEANILRITPEMKEKILKEGIQSFSDGGIVDSGIAHLNTSKKGRANLNGLAQKLKKKGFLVNHVSKNAGQEYKSILDALELR